MSAAEWLRDNSRCLRDDLTALVDDPQRLDNIADRSSIHPNGFAKIVLYPDERFGVRLHIWSRREGLWAEEERSRTVTGGLSLPGSSSGVCTRSATPPNRGPGRVGSTSAMATSVRSCDLD